MSRFGELINTKDLTKTKIVATLGPASDSEEVLVGLVKAGMDVARLNFSHGSIEEKTVLFNLLRSIGEQYMHQLSILADIQGPKIRTGIMEEAFTVTTGDILRVTPDKIVGSKEKGIQISYANMMTDLKIGDDIFINDGIIKITVIEKEESFLVCEVVSGGTISDRKGCNIPSGNLSVNIITKKDEEDLKLIAQLKPDFLAASFVGTAKDIHQIRSKLAEYGNHTIKIIAKIERPTAVENIDEIIEAADGIMVARGDLGVEIDTWLVPVVQKELCAKCNRIGKPVIVATQMLESMTNSSRPTRAEASDVFNAVLDGADAVMLSGETSIGVDPVHVVNIMDTIIRNAEKHLERRNSSVQSDSVDDITGNSILQMSLQIQQLGKTGKILIYGSRSTKFARMISKYRPPMDIIAFSHSKKVVRKLNLQWGVRAVLLETGHVHSIPDKTRIVVESLRELDILEADDYIIFCARTKGQTPNISLYETKTFLSLEEDETNQ